MIPPPSPSVKIQIQGGKLCLRCKGKTLLGVVNKKFVDISQQWYTLLPQVNFPAHNLNFRWRWWWDQGQAIFLNLFYFKIHHPYGITSQKLYLNWPLKLSFYFKLNNFQKSAVEKKVGQSYESLHLINAKFKTSIFDLQFWRWLDIEKISCRGYEITDKRTDVWSRDFIIWKINSGLWSQWSGLDCEIKGSGPIMSNFWDPSKKSYNFFWKHYSVRTEKLHNTFFTIFFSNFENQKKWKKHFLIGLKFEWNLSVNTWRSGLALDFWNAG